MNYRILISLVFTVALPLSLNSDVIVIGEPHDRLCLISRNAKYATVNGRIIPEEGFFSYFAPHEFPLQPYVEYPRIIDRGDLLKVTVVDPESWMQLTVQLFDKENTLTVESVGFLGDSIDGMQVWVCLLTVPSTMNGGTHTLIINGKDMTREFALYSKISIREKVFVSEVIHLDRALTELRTKPDPRKTEEAEQLLTLLSEVNNAAIHHKDFFQLPLDEIRQTAGFGDRRIYQYYNGNINSAIHSGVDFAAPTGTSVRASASGKVVFAGERIVTGNTVVIEHLPAVYSLYHHLSGIMVEYGDFVEGGTPIGVVGSSGLATGAHLHWEIRVSGMPVNPFSFLSTKVVDTEYILNILNTPTEQDIGGR